MSTVTSLSLPLDAQCIHIRLPYDPLGPQQTARAPLFTSESPGELPHRGVQALSGLAALAYVFPIVLVQTVTVSCPLTAVPVRLLSMAMARE